MRSPATAVAALVGLLVAASPAAANVDAAVQSPTTSYSQNWANPALITTNDNWSGVTGVQGYLGADASTTTAGTDPQTIVVPFSDTDVVANSTNPDASSLAGGVHEFDGLANPTIALSGSGGADYPSVVFRLDTTGRENATFAYNARDLDASADNTTQQLALQYRVGGSGNFTNLPSGFVADATTGPSIATQVTPVSVTLPDATDNQPEVYVRVITANAPSTDEPTGIDDVTITSSPVGGGTDTAPSVTATSPANSTSDVSVGSNVTVTFSEAVDAAAGAFSIVCGGVNQPFTASGSPATTFTLDPTSDLPAGSTCTVTVEADDVTDVDASDPPDNPAADFTSSFTTAVVDAAPTVQSVSPANGASGIPASTNVVVTFSEPVTAPDGAFSLTCGGATRAVAVSNSAQTTYTLDPTADLPTSASCTVGVAATQVSDVDANDPPDTMASDFSSSFTTAAAALQPSAVQGTGSATTLSGTRTVEGVVTKLVAAGSPEGPTGTTGGFVVQNTVDDDNAATSNGLLVNTTSDNPIADIAVGDVVRVTGTVGENFGLTRIVATSATETGTQAVPSPVDVTLPLNDSGREARELMLVRLTQALSVTELRNVDNFGEVRLSQGGPLQTPTDVVEPGTPAQTRLAENRDRNVLLDDNRGGTPSVVPYLDDVANPPLRRGDTTTNVTGVLSFGFSEWRVQPTAAPTWTKVNPRPAAPDPVGGDVQIASYNVENYFTTLTTEDSRARGARSAAQLAKQREKVTAGIRGLDADVLALQEVQDTSSFAGSSGNPDGALADLVQRINAGQPTDAQYDFVPLATPDNNTDVIRNAIIFRPSVVSRVGAARTVESTAFNNARDPQAQVFEAQGDRFTVIANHLKSKSPGSPTGDNVDSGDGQGEWNGDRKRQATVLRDWVTMLRDTTEENDVFVLGDLNAYSNEDPIDVLRGPGSSLRDVTARLPLADRYSYVFDGFQGRLDHALATPTADAKVTGADIWHINADESDLYTYFGARGAAEASGSPYRASDHDPTIFGFDAVTPSAPGTLGFDPATVATPERGEATLTVRRTNGSQGTVTAQVETADDSARAGSDYTARSSTLTFAAGETTKTVTVPIADDGADEPDETFRVRLSAPSSGATLGASTATVTIADDDEGAPSTGGGTTTTTTPSTTPPGGTGTTPTGPPSGGNTTTTPSTSPPARGFSSRNGSPGLTARFSRRGTRGTFTLRNLNRFRVVATGRFVLVDRGRRTVLGSVRGTLRPRTSGSQRIRLSAAKLRVLRRASRRARVVVALTASDDARVVRRGTRSLRLARR